MESRMTGHRCLMWLLVLSLMVTVNCVSSETPAPPPDTSTTPQYLINDMETTARVDGDLVRFSTRLAFTTRTEGWHSFKLFPLQASLTEYKVKKGKEKNLLLSRKRDGYYLFAGAPAVYEIQVDYVARIRREKLGYATTLYFIPAANNSSVRFNIPFKDAQVSVQPEINYGVVPGRSNTEVVLYNTMVEEAVLSWSGEEAARIVPTYFAEQRSFYSVTRGNLRVESNIEYSVLKGEVDRVEIALSPELSVVSVNGDNIRKWDTRDDKDGKILTVERSSSQARAFTVNLVAEKVLEQLPITFSAPRIQPLGVEREKGYIALNVHENLRIEPVKMENIAQVDIQEIALERKPSKPFDLVFKYLKRPFTLALTADNIPPKVWADIAAIAYPGKDSVKMDVNILYSIYDAGVSRFRIKLEPGLKVSNITRGANINNWQVKDDILTVDLKSKTQGTASYYQLAFLADKETKSSAKVSLPIITVLDVEREQGYIGVASSKNIKSEVITFEGINQIDIKEFQPVVMRADKDKSETASKPETASIRVLDNVPALDFAFRYFKHPYSVGLSLSDIKAEVTAEVRSVMKLDERKVGLTYQILYTIRKSGVFNLKMNLPKELHIADLKGANIDDWKRNGDELNVILSTRVDGSYTLSIDTEILLDKLDKTYAVPVLRLIDIKKEYGYLVIKSDPALRIKSDTKNLAKLTEIDLKDIPRDMYQPDLTLAYKYFEQPWSLTLDIERLKPTVMAETFQFISVGEAILHSASTIKYQILYAAMGQFKVQLPKEAVNVDINGQNIKHKGEEKTADGILWTISLHSPAKDIYNLYISFQTEMKKDKDGKFEAIRYDGIKALEVERETGYLAVVARPDMELTTPETENLTPIDEREIPQDYIKGIDAPILMSFRYLKHPYKLATKVNQNKFSEVLVAVIDAARLSTTVSENGQMITDIVCQIRNTREQYLRMSLPNDANIWHVRVAGQPVSCFTADAKDATGEEKVEPQRNPATNGGSVPITLIPIAQQSKSEQAFEVNIRYATRMGSLGSIGKVNLACPQMNIPVMRLGWTVSLPDKYQIVRDSGNMEPVTVFEGGIAMLDFEQRKQPETQPTPPQQERQQQVQVAQSGQTVDWQSASNSMALENTRGVQVTTTPSGGKVGGVPSVYGGRKPISTNNYHFQSIIPLDIPGRISARYLSRPFHNIIKGLLAILVILGSALFWMKSMATVQKKVAILIGAIVALIGIHTLSADSYADIINTIIWTGATATMVIILIIGFKDYLYPVFNRRSVSAERQRSPDPIGRVPTPVRGGSPHEASGVKQAVPVRTNHATPSKDPAAPARTDTQSGAVDNPADENK